MEYSFLDEDFDGQYKSEQRLENLFSIFSALTIFIACIGLFGLISFISEQRTKEIGIRKVLGASVEDVVLLLSKDFLKLVLFANLLALPLAWFVINKWLQNFAYRIDINFVNFILTAIITLLIAFISISGKTIMVALTDPVKSLKYE
jgi:putative ABC transport system permease protein